MKTCFLIIATAYAGCFGMPVMDLISSAPNFGPPNIKAWFTNYYWRDYNGEIPEDAIEGGMDANGKPTYIGQAYIKQHYLQVVEINPGNAKVVGAHYNAVYETDLYVKILCSRNKPGFKWKPFDKDVNSTVNNAVVGGLEDSSRLFIGRIAYQGKVRVGKATGSGTFYFPYNKDELKTTKYEILTYTD